jgi:hypothetical protein
MTTGLVIDFLKGQDSSFSTIPGIAPEDARFWVRFPVMSLEYILVT